MTQGAGGKGGQANARQMFITKHCVCAKSRAGGFPQDPPRRAPPPDPCYRWRSQGPRHLGPGRCFPGLAEVLTPPSPSPSEPSCHASGHSRAPNDSRTRRAVPSAQMRKLRPWEVRWPEASRVCLKTKASRGRRRPSTPRHMGARGPHPLGHAGGSRRSPHPPAAPAPPADRQAGAPLLHQH